mmetsp:Transcript_46348/g.83521  ORF Transcript_46348/g.83521 Transcript_46348/m.83521 type:complete len:167 (+) Transcript_46348:94-594(+)
MGAAALSSQYKTCCEEAKFEVKVCVQSRQTLCSEPSELQLEEDDLTPRGSTCERTVDSEAPQEQQQPWSPSQSSLDTQLFEGQLCGMWRRVEDNSKVGVITGNELVWDPSFRARPSKLREVDLTTIGLVLNGTMYTGRVSVGVNTRIVWSDGEAWWLQCLIRSRRE